MAAVRQLPDALAEAVLLWKTAGENEQPPSRWSPAAWQRWLPDHADYISSLPQPIDRRDVTARCAAAPTGPDPATQAFIAAMIWGYGPVGYGGFRTRRVLTENVAAGEALTTMAGIAREEGGPAAFAWLAQKQHRLRYLGVAFATKFLFFCAANGQGQPALVLDRLVRDWLLTKLDWSLSLEWDVDDYCAYVETVSTWATELAIEPGNLEMIVFQLAANADPRSLWSAPDLFASTPPDSTTHVTDGPESLSDETAGGGALQVVQKLNEAASMFARLPGPADTDEAADFERSMRELKRIVLLRQ